MLRKTTNACFGFYWELLIKLDNEEAYNARIHTHSVDKIDRKA